MAGESKIIRKTDTSAISLLYEILGVETKNIAHIDSYYNINGTYHFLEFIKCDCRPFEYDPNQNWQQLKDQISILWDFTFKAEGTLWLVCYEVKKEQFKLFRVKALSEMGIEFAEEIRQDFDQFKYWFQKMNSDVLKG